jgi:hypothetical protein
MGVAGTESRFQDMEVKVNSLTIDEVAVTATAAEINRVADLSAKLVAGGASLALTAATHDSKTITFSAASGTALTLPAATGSGASFRCVVATTVTSNAHTLACAGSDAFAGVVYQVDSDTSDTVAAYPALAADAFDIISMNGTTTGGLQGDWFEVIDIATGIWALKGFSSANGTVATPLAAS